MQTLDKKVIAEFQREKRKYFLEPEITKKEIRKLKKNIPFQKIIGFIEMADIKIDLSQKVLIPRYETEELIFLAKSLLLKNSSFKKVLDIGTGSGFIALALKKALPFLEIDASDISFRAQKQCLINQKINHLKINFIHSNLFNNISKKYDVIISNPPYLSLEEYKTLDKSVQKYDPKRALVSRDPLFFYQEIIKNTKKHLNKDGLLIFEINPNFASFFIENNFSIVKDINQKERFAYKIFN
ncbi:MAG: peptide chain release factor N(5)-glutamine methyltransferase [Metamycoplasmataceae bacterium]